MRREAGRVAMLAFMIAAAGAFAAGASANSAGAPEGSAIDGCTCHAPQPSNEVTVSLAGLPDAYEPGEDYTLTVSVEGPAPLPGPLAQAQGGFQVVVDVGLLSPGDNMAGNVNETTVTHNTAGNDQREWFVVWSAPVGSEVGLATFWFAGNAVNGDNLNQNDAWNQDIAQVPPIGGSSTDGADDDDSGEAAAPALPAPVAWTVVIAVAALWGRRLRPQ